jgi:cystathionine beta-lyase/cystathionine gamma-synthase
MEDFRKRYIKFDPEEMTSTLPPSPAPSSPRPTGRRYALATELVFVDNPESGGIKDQYGASSMPIYQTATFKQTSASEMGEYDYTRSGNPTRSHLERHLAKIMSANRALVVSSGMAALDVISRLLKPGDEVIAGDDLYGGIPMPIHAKGKQEQTDSSSISRHTTESRSAMSTQPI